VRLGYQVSVDIVAHHQNLAQRGPGLPVICLTEVLTDTETGDPQRVQQVRFTGPARTEYGWGPERAHARGVRGGAHVWVFTEHPVEYLDAAGAWHTTP
jgi:hypothetical protein